MIQALIWSWVCNQLLNCVVCLFMRQWSYQTKVILTVMFLIIAEKLWIILISAMRQRSENLPVQTLNLSGNCYLNLKSKILSAMISRIWEEYLAVSPTYVTTQSIEFDRIDDGYPHFHKNCSFGYVNATEPQIFTASACHVDIDNVCPDTELIEIDSESHK